MLPLTPVAPQTAGERALFAELTRWDRGGAVRGAVVAALPVLDGQLGRRVSDAVLFVPEGLAVLRVAEVVRQTGVVTATPEGAWTIGPGAGPGEVLQLAGGGSTPLDGLMRAGMDTAVRLRGAGLEPGRVARVTVLAGELTGLLPADGDLGDGDQVALLEPRSLLLGISRAARYSGVDNPRLWTTADVRAALTALGYEGRGPTVEELNGEGFPYSPYVLRRRELLTPAAMAASPVAGAVLPAPADAAVLPVPPASPLVPAPAGPPAGPLVDPVAAAAVAAAAIRADEEAAARAAAGFAPPADLPPADLPPSDLPVPAPAVPAPRPATHRFEAPAVESGAGAPPAAVHETGGLGGLFGGGDAGPVSWPPAAAVPVAVPAPPPEPPAGAPTPPPAGPGRSPDARRRLAVLAAAALLAVVVLAGLVAGLTGGGGGDAAAQEPAPAPSAAAPPTAAGPTPGTTTVLDGRAYVLQQVQVEGTCLGNAYGQVASFFEAGDCAGLARALWSTDVAGRAAVVSVAKVDAGDTVRARALRELADTNGSGNVSDLLREGVGYPGGPAALSGAEYASAVGGSIVTIVETAWADGAGGAAPELDLVAGAGLALPMPVPAAG